MTSVDAGLKAQEVPCLTWILAFIINLHGEIFLCLLDGFLVGVDCLLWEGGGGFSFSNCTSVIVIPK